MKRLNYCRMSRRLVEFIIEAKLRSRATVRTFENYSKDSDRKPPLIEI